ncbi:1511_t:CDS:2 [Ambispora gerdemannii]|uniref:1511_t:CDS:1 n=1 Tax=Ambispora gerdemannii TaxID=144530 RepID=A0A9N9BUN1_9GLOM|nr:1511_t:CDS:2 [Ambispora gerdemannii]
MKVVVIGGTGFIGKYVAKAFIRYPNASIQLVARNPKLDQLQNLGNQILPPIKTDITSPLEVLEACKGANVVINLVGIMHEKPPKYTFESVQHQGARNVAVAARENNATLVHVSAIGADPNTDIPYARTKGLGESSVRQEYPNSVIIRPSLVFGPEDDFFNRFAKLARLLPFMPVFGGGTTKFQPIHVCDLADAIFKTAADPKYQGKIIEAGGPTVYNYREIMQLTLDQAGIKRPIVSMPWSIGLLQGFFLEKLPLNLFTITRDQVKLLQKDNIVHANSDILTLKDLGINSPREAEKILHQYLRNHDAVTPNKRTHRMVEKSIEDEIAEIGRIRRKTPKKAIEIEAEMLKKQKEHDAQVKK